MPSIGCHEAFAVGAAPSTFSIGCASARSSVTVRISRAARIASFASAVPDTAARAGSNRFERGSRRNSAGTSPGATYDHGPASRFDVVNQRPADSR